MDDQIISEVMPDLPKRTPRPWIAEPKPFDGMKHPNYALYNSKAWRMASKAYRMKHPLCEICEKEGRITEATTVDHIIPINKGGAVWDSSNWQSLCAKCNAKKTGGQR